MSGPLELGVIVRLTEDVAGAFDFVGRLGLPTCQLSCWQPNLLTPAMARRVREAVQATRIRVSSFWAGYSGVARWNLAEGPRTIGLVPRQTRTRRMRELLRGVHFAAAIGAPSVTTHVGFIPEDPGDPDYARLLPALRSLAARCAAHALRFCFETGQETPVTLLRTMQDVGAPNVGVNLDPANLILYGKGNPVDALDVFGGWVCGLHAKDGLYPTDGRSLGRETPLGQGRVDFPALLRRLKELHYAGPVTIEREVSGPQQARDVRAAMRYLEPLL